MFPEIPDCFSKYLENVFSISQKSSKNLRNIWLHFINITQISIQQISGNYILVQHIQQNSKQFHKKSALFTVPLSLQED